jgi:hypothetical protein
MGNRVRDAPYRLKNAPLCPKPAQHKNKVGPEEYSLEYWHIIDFLFDGTRLILQMNTWTKLETDFDLPTVLPVSTL